MNISCIFISRISQTLKTITLAVVCVLVFIINTESYSAELYLTEEEKNYIAEKNIIIAASLDGSAPLHYIDSKGKIRGIAVNVMEEISDMTGLIFEYKLYDSIDDVDIDESDIYFSISSNYASPDIVLSLPYLKTETILFFNSSLNSNELKDKRYAAVRGGELPEGVSYENTIYYGNREDTLNAVNSGRADYGYGNTYSVAFYILQNGYKNIVSIPKGKESREYCVGFARKNDVLLSIINKSIEEIDEQRMQTIILDMASNIDRKITFAMVLEAYSKEIFMVVLQMMAILLFFIILSVNSNRKLSLQNKRYMQLSNISNEYLFEYSVYNNELTFSEKTIELFGVREKLDEAKDMLKNYLLDEQHEEVVSTIKLSRSNGETAAFRIIKSNIYDEKKRLHSIIGKFIDISRETEEREKLITMAQLDGLTGLYNNVTTKKLIMERIKNKDSQETDAFILLDCDSFKEINDRYGHLAGDRVLKGISAALKTTFRETDIIGRIGGDEFCVYIRNISSVDFIKSKLNQLTDTIKEISNDFPIYVSTGISFLKEEKTYIDLFKEADEALYKAKQKGGSVFVMAQTPSIHQYNINITKNVKKE